MDLAATEFRGVGYLDPDPSWRMHAHFHPFHEIIAVVAGRMQVQAGGETVVGVAGDVLLYPAQLIHEERADPQCPVKSYFASFALESVPAGRFLRVRDRDGRIAQLMRWLYDDEVATARPNQSKLDSLMHVIVAEFFELRGVCENELVTRVRRYVRAHIAEPQCLSLLARHAAMSRFHFLRTYRTLAGRTPMEEVRCMRLDHARNLLLSTSLTLKEIAARAGLGSEQSMCRLFRRRFGTPPGEFRRHLKRREPAG